MKELKEERVINN